MIAITVIGIIVGFVLLDLAIRRWQDRLAPRVLAHHATTSGSSSSRPVLLSDFLLPTNYFLHPGHTWLRIREKGCVTVGIDDFVAKTLGRIERIDLPRVGAEIRSNAPAFTISQGRKRASLPAPVSGTVTGVNTALAENPDLLAERPYESGWVLEIRPASLQEDLARLSIAGGAVEWLKREIRSFREFLMELAGRESALGTTLADGGLPVSGVLEHFDRNEWEEYQKRFLKVSNQGFASNE